MRLFAFALSILTVFASAPATLHAGESAWQDHQGMLETRIVSASADMGGADGSLFAWEARLAPGWKTYWRSPGEAGLPVRVQLEGQPIELEFPFPDRFELFGLETYGYANKVLLPFYAEVERGQPLTVTSDFMVCKDICVPFVARYKLEPADIAPERSVHDFRIETWLGQVPDRKGEADVGLRIISAQVMGTPGHQRVIVEAVADTDLSNADMLAEAGEMFHFAAPQMRLLENGEKARFVLLGMTGKKPEDLRGKTVRLTFTDGHGHAIDRKVKLEP
ncbi:protein-disulfide reductase DsbD domain-containing protein [Kordiimonas sp.]|uniref:protein-disulfide reductase DsbD domain-containing protein n=1 Tax=Kordiimonas sp. TaxID=1970157 RepID=UPI003A9101C7